MKHFGFILAHGYELWKGYVTANDEEEAAYLIAYEHWDDIVDEYDTDEFTEGYEIVEIWECKD